MTVSLLSLSKGGCSLEFEPADLPAVKAAIHALYGTTQVARGPIPSSVRFGGEDFTFQNEWDDPCLITSTPGVRRCSAGWRSGCRAELLHFLDFRLPRP